jgi:hypothetical protein
MIVFGAGASSCAAKCKKFAFSRNIEVTITAVPTGTTTGAADPARPDLNVLLRNLLRAPFEAGAVGPDAVLDDVNARSRSTSFLRLM